MTFGQEYPARASYLGDFRAGRHRLVVAVACQLGPLPYFALLDTAADWCVLPPDVADALGCELEPDPEVPPYSTRQGLMLGRHERIPVTLLAGEGEPREVDATWFVSVDWAGPIVIGWKGCLERLRFALDPTPGEEWFYFGPIDESS